VVNQLATIAGREFYIGISKLNQDITNGKELEHGTPETRLFSIRGVAERWSVSEKLIWSLVNSQTLRSIRLGKRVLICESELLRFVRDAQQEPEGVREEES
jgi:predicted DNA-binding transcriptional regulator AlpA